MQVRYRAALHPEKIVPRSCQWPVIRYINRAALGPWGGKASKVPDPTNDRRNVMISAQRMSQLHKRAKAIRTA